MRQRDTIDILEEAVNLLRSAPLSALVPYLVGAIPFVVALLFFLNDMTRSPFASEHLAAASLGLAFLYVWKNAWQAVFAAQLHEILSPGHFRAKNLLRAIPMQAALQPIGLVLALPFPWLVAFFRNVGLFSALGVPDSVRVARRQAMLWTRQNWGILALTSLAGLLLFANLLITIAILPQIARSFLGIEGDFARAGARILNLSTIAVAAALAWLVIDPLLDAVYVLRCFYGESIASGEDLRAALRKAMATAALLLIILGVAPARLSAQVDPVKLDHSIDQVIHSREFAWRAPRAAGEEPKGRWVGWVRAVEDMFGKAWDWMVDTIRKWFEQHPQEERQGQDAPVTRRMLETMIVLVLAIIAGAAVAFFVRKRPPTVAAQAVTMAASAVDLADESVTPDQLPEDRWLQLSDELLAKGDFRLALRAQYLAALNFLGRSGMVSIRRWKSGLDYRREFDRRARATPKAGVVFARGVAVFDRGWYGSHPVDRQMVETFASDLRELKKHF
jgi:hypothetical protein